MSNSLCKIYDFGSKFAQTYEGKCECGKVIKISAQKDSDPEYYTDIFVMCDCGKSVAFILPIN